MLAFSDNTTFLKDRSDVIASVTAFHRKFILLYKSNKRLIDGYFRLEIILRREGRMHF